MNFGDGNKELRVFTKGTCGRRVFVFVAEHGEHRITLFFTGWRHAGENLTEASPTGPTGLTEAENWVRFVAFLKEGDLLSLESHRKRRCSVF